MAEIPNNSEEDAGEEGEGEKEAEVDDGVGEEGEGEEEAEVVNLRVRYNLTLVK